MRKGVVGRANWAAGRTWSWSGERGAGVVHGGGSVPKSGASETLGVHGAEGKGNERAERWWVGEGNVRDKGTGWSAEASGGLTTARSGGNDCSPRDLEMLRRGERWRGESRTNGWEWMGTLDASGRGALARCRNALERSREPGSMA
jgi:hypothetical protein